MKKIALLVIAAIAVTALAGDVPIIQQHDPRYDHLIMALRHQCLKESTQCFADIPAGLPNEAAFNIRYSDCCIVHYACAALPNSIVAAGWTGTTNADANRYCEGFEAGLDAATRYETLKAMSLAPLADDAEETP